MIPNDFELIQSQNSSKVPQPPGSIIIQSLLSNNKSFLSLRLLPSTFIILVISLSSSLSTQNCLWITPIISPPLALAPLFNAPITPHAPPPLTHMKFLNAINDPIYHYISLR